MYKIRRIQSTKLNLDTEEGRFITLVNKAVDDICNVKINWRTAYKLTQYCAVCGSNKEVEYHHIKHIKIGEVIGFLQVLKQLNRKQLPVCKECHVKIHNGTYDNLNINDLYD